MERAIIFASMNKAPWTHAPKRALQTLAAAAVLSAAPAAALADPCGSSSATHCWTDLTSHNYSQVALGTSGNGVGIACAIAVGNTSDYGGDLDCFVASGASSATVMGRGGYQAQNFDLPYNPIPFLSTDPNRRFKSVAISPAPGDNVTIWALRSDGKIYAADTRWPLGPDPRIYFSPIIPTYPTNLRSIAYVPGLLYNGARDIGLAGITVDNMLYYRMSVYEPWALVTSGAILVAGTADRVGALLLAGQDAYALPVVSLNGGVSPPPLPVPLANPFRQADANYGNYFGPLTGLAVGTDRGLFVADDDSPGCPPTNSSLIPCIFSARASFAGGSAVPTGWSAWTFLSTGTSSRPNLVSIQEGSKFRGRDGEIWAITQFNHLITWTP